MANNSLIHNDNTSAAAFDHLAIMNDDAMTETSAGLTVLTPSTSRETIDVAGEDPFDAAPWNGNTYVIRVKGSDQAITLTEGRLHLEEVGGRKDGRNCWQCREDGMYNGFYNEHAKVFLGHDGNSGMRASASALKDWEKIVAKRHPIGGYELQSPHWMFWSRFINVTADRRDIVRGDCRCTLWEFERI